ncbi:hypothetical protein A3841_08850 [Pontibacter flavimaris]|uniref:Uncharacterized protein n=1 Tax=Pontibacter flavimaris TaxID=1797110 RepID=A0A1Q5PIQ3_9BACT|nr:hypothetical protein A3841_08850 [Pontibacter flavimaris]
MKKQEQKKKARADWIRVSQQLGLSARPSAAAASPAPHCSDGPGTCPGRDWLAAQERCMEAIRAPGYG